MDESKSTGERLLTGYFDRFSVEHIHRYALACDISLGLNVLDIACGEGYGSKLLAKNSNTVVGVDIDSEIINHARTKYVRPNLQFHVGAADAIPLPDSSVDLVVSFETLEHHDRHEEMYIEIKRVLRPGGVLIISTPDKYYFSDQTGHRNAYHVKELYLDEFVDLNLRHFKNVAIYDQKAVLGSLIIPEENSRSFNLHSGDHTETNRDTRFKNPTYHLCLASDVDLPHLGPSLFDGVRLLDDMENKLREQDEQISKINARLDASARVLGDLRASISYRLGQGLTYPIRLLFGRK